MILSKTCLSVQLQSQNNYSFVPNKRPPPCLLIFGNPPDLIWTSPLIYLFGKISISATAKYQKDIINKEDFD